MNKLKLNTDIYSLEKIEMVIKTYKDYTRICVKKYANYIELEFKDSKYDETITVKEFENFLINMESISL